MPMYEFERISTGERWEELTTFAGRLEILEDSDIKQIIYAPALVSSVDTGRRVDDGFKEVLSKAAEAHPTSALSNKVRTKGVKEAKTQAIKNKYF